ncbi:MAG: aminopeptidase P family protein [Eubacterium sp.]|nr:aminopeptidase P family protein [Eubacterium sp.]
MPVLEKANKLLEDARVDAVILTDPTNMRYLTGFTGEGYVIVSKTVSQIVTDSRYTLEATEKLADSGDIEVVEWNKKGYYRPVMDFVKNPQIKSIGFEDRHLTVAAYRRFEKRLQRYVKLKPLHDAADALRQVKSPDEIEKIRLAEEIGDRAFARLMLDFGVSPERLGKAGEEVSAYHVPDSMIPTETSEKEIAWALERYLRIEGGERLSFDTIAASGLNGAKPHAIPTDKTPAAGELLTLDFGCVYNGYCSDMTRTIAVGEPSDELKRIYDTVLCAQETALNEIRPGMTGAEIDALARDVIKEAGYGDKFGHSLGHSVGLNIHESPGFSSKEKTVIMPGMVVSVEPGIYVENVGGVRIEDLVAITEDGIENLAKSEKSLIVI